MTPNSTAPKDPSLLPGAKAQGRCMSSMGPWKSEDEPPPMTQPSPGPCASMPEAGLRVPRTRQHRTAQRAPRTEHLALLTPKSIRAFRTAPSSSAASRSFFIWLKRDFQDAAPRRNVGGDPRRPEVTPVTQRSSTCRSAHLRVPSQAGCAVELIIPGDRRAASTQSGPLAWLRSCLCQRRNQGVIPPRSGWDPRLQPGKVFGGSIESGSVALSGSQNGDDLSGESSYVDGAERLHFDRHTQPQRAIRNGGSLDASDRVVVRRQMRAAPAPRAVAIDRHCAWDAAQHLHRRPSEQPDPLCSPLLIATRRHPDVDHDSARLRCYLLSQLMLRCKSQRARRSSPAEWCKSGS